MKNSDSSMQKKIRETKIQQSKVPFTKHTCWVLLPRRIVCSGISMFWNFKKKKFIARNIQIFFWKKKVLLCAPIMTSIQHLIAKQTIFSYSLDGELRYK